MLMASGDIGRDMAQMRAFYADVVGKFPASATPVRLREEDQSVSAAS